MTKSSTEYIRSTFIDYFKKNGHKHLPASSLIPQNDPSLMFVNSGMVQFKNIFTGKEKAPHARAVTSQKALRAGGKHNDIDQVGRTARHHTFFEMLGNFSFGDYFKEEAISHAWNLIAKEYKINTAKLCVTVYHEDEEAASLWRRIAGFNDDKIIRIKTADNFWSMGELGPCGPCSEIFYDHGPEIAGGPPGSPDEDGDRFVEIWNLVFMQYEQISKSQRVELPNKSIDTGMGLERMAAVLQGVHNNYDIDIFKQLIKQTAELLSVDSNEATVVPLRVIADHIRATSFLIADGVMPSNDGRGYVLRRIMRRAMRFINQLGANKPVMYKLLPKMVDIFGHVYPEIGRGEEYISGVIQQEEERFLHTLKKGMKLLDKEYKDLSGDSLSGEVAFKLYDTYGFPLDLTENILEAKGIKIDHDGFEAQMQKQKDQARKAWVGSGQDSVDDIYFDLLEQYGPTEFVGYNMEKSAAKVMAIIADNKNLNKAEGINDKFLMITNQTPFYGESGGQMGDVGMAIVPNVAKIKILNTNKALGKLHIHVCKLLEGSIEVGDEVDLAIDSAYRRDLKMHHSATHILHAVLRKVLGGHVTQKGSLVANSRLRFDFSHPSAVTDQQLEQIEKLVNKIITNNSPVKTELMSSAEAIESGAMALFGEKYDDEVRVVSMGVEADADAPYSFELCGGTHVSRCGDVGAFKIMSETAIAGGIRRIEAVCGEYAFDYIQQKEEVLRQMAHLFKCPPAELPSKASSLLNQKKQLENDLAKLKEKSINLSASQLQEAIRSVEGIKLLYRELSDVDMKIIRKHCEQLINNNSDLVLLYLIKNDNKYLIVTGAGGSIQSKISANSLATIIGDFTGGKGGGSSKISQIGGQIDASKAKDIASNLNSLVANSLNS